MNKFVKLWNYKPYKIIKNIGTIVLNLLIMITCIILTKLYLNDDEIFHTWDFAITVGCIISVFITTFIPNITLTNDKTEEKDGCGNNG